MKVAYSIRSFNSYNYKKNPVFTVFIVKAYIFYNLYLTILFRPKSRTKSKSEIPIQTNPVTKSLEEEINKETPDDEKVN